MSAKRPSILPTIIEDRHEVTLNIVCSIICLSRLAITDTKFKPSAVLIDFSLDSEDGAFGNATYRRCIRRDTGVFYALKRARTNLGSTTRERSILEALTAKSVPFVTRLKWVFQDGDQSFWVIVSLGLDFHLLSDLVDVFRTTLTRAVFLNMYNCTDVWTQCVQCSMHQK